jgi:hypothetical protein
LEGVQHELRPESVRNAIKGVVQRHIVLDAVQRLHDREQRYERVMKLRDDLRLAQVLQLLASLDHYGAISRLVERRASAAMPPNKRPLQLGLVRVLPDLPKYFDFTRELLEKFWTYVALAQYA